MAQTVKDLPAMQETWIQSLGREDTLKKGIATYTSILAWRIPWTEEPGRLQSMASQSRTRLSDYTHTRAFSTYYLLKSIIISIISICNLILNNSCFKLLASKIP